MKKKSFKKPNLITYYFTKFLSSVICLFSYKRKFIRNEIKNVKCGYLLLCNHESSLDFIPLMGATKRRMTIVTSKSFYESLPINPQMRRLGIIPKQQFQTTLKDMRLMKSAIENNRPLVMYPAGLMPDNGVSTPIPQTTYKFLKWLDTDVYVSRIYGSYFVNPKWGKGFRSGRVFIDIYKLFSKEDLKVLTDEEIKEKLDSAIIFNAYKEQENLKISYKNGENIEGLQNVLYSCPICNKEYSTKIKNTNVIYCENCSFEEQADKFGFLHSNDSINEIKYVCDWDKIIYENLRKEVFENPDYSISDETDVYTLDYKKHKYVLSGTGKISINRTSIDLDGVINGEEKHISLNISTIPALASSPGKHIEIQLGNDIYRAKLKDGSHVVKYLHLLKIFFELNNGYSLKY